MRLLLTDLSGNIIAFIFGLLFWKGMRLPYRVIFLQVAAGLCVEVYAGFFMKVNNLALYKYYLLADGWLIMSAGYFFIKRKSFFWIAAAMMLYTAYWLVSSFPTDFSKVYILSSALLVVIYFFVLYYAVIHTKAAPRKLPELWIAAGIIVFYACNIPYFSMISSVTKLSHGWQEGLHVLLLCLAHIRYLCMATGFYLTAKNTGAPRQA